MHVKHTKAVFVGGSLVAAGVHFEVADGSKLERGMVEVSGANAAVVPKGKDAPKSKDAPKGKDAPTKAQISGDEPDTLAAMTKATVEGDKKADPAQG